MMKKRILLFITILIMCGCEQRIVVNVDKLEMFDKKFWLNQSYYKGSEVESRIIKLDKEIEVYVSTHTDTNPTVKEAMKNFTIIKGMNQEQVAMLLIGTPNEKIINTNHEVIWLYSPLYDVSFHWYDQFGRFTFTDGILTKIQKEHIRYNYL